MSEPLPPYPPQDNYNSPYEHQYASVSPYGSAPTLVKVAAILNLIMCGFDIIWGLIILLVGLMMATGVIPKSAIDNPPGTYDGPPLPIVGAIIAGVSLLPLAAGVLKLIAGMKLLRRSAGAWGWGLAAGIVGCTQLWCSYFCILPLGIGIYTIVAMCIENVRRYLNDSAQNAIPTQP